MLPSKRNCITLRQMAFTTDSPRSSQSRRVSLGAGSWIGSIALIRQLHLRGRVDLRLQTAHQSYLESWAIRWNPGPSVQRSLWKGYIRPVRGWSGVVYQVYEAYVRPPLGNSPPVMTLDLRELHCLGPSQCSRSKIARGPASVFRGLVQSLLRLLSDVDSCRLKPLLAPFSNHQGTQKFRPFSEGPNQQA